MAGRHRSSALNSNSKVSLDRETTTTSAVTLTTRRAVVAEPALESTP